ncbi:hypothetical protein HYW82_01975 [Candidatus Peregrinibacteria bacterium]|nr:hypothetical protein [Candidatus Peregrinibacteria bacterium]
MNGETSAPEDRLGHEDNGSSNDDYDLREELAGVRERILHPVHPDISITHLRDGDDERFSQEAINDLKLEAEELGITLVLPPYSHDMVPPVFDSIRGRALRTIQTQQKELGARNTREVSGNVVVKVRPGDRSLRLGVAGSDRETLRLEELLGAKVRKLTNGQLALKGSYLKPSVSVEEFFGSKTPRSEYAGIEQAFIGLLQQADVKLPGILEQVLDAQTHRRRGLLWEILSNAQENRSEDIVREGFSASHIEFVYLFYTPGDKTMKLLQHEGILSPTGSELIEGVLSVTGHTPKEGIFKKSRTRKDIARMLASGELVVFKFRVPVIDQAEGIMRHGSQY